MGDDKNTPLKLNFDPKVRLDYRGAAKTSDAGLRHAENSFTP